MSIRSYYRNVERKVTGPHLPTCMPAALEQISPDHSYRPKIYEDYTEFINWYSYLSRQKRDEHVSDYEDIVSDLVKPLGGLALDDLVFRRATTFPGFMRHINMLQREDYRIAIDIWPYGKRGHTSHTVGLIPINGETEHVTLVSTHIPKNLEGIIPISKVFARLAIHDDIHMPNHLLNDANILGIPNIDF